jgi:hypothetical protein
MRIFRHSQGKSDAIFTSDLGTLVDHLEIFRALFNTFLAKEVDGAVLDLPDAGCKKSH